MLLAGRRGGRRGGQDCGRERRRRSRRRGGGRKRPQVQCLERYRRRRRRPRRAASGATPGHRSAWGSSQQTWASPQHTQCSRSSRSRTGTRTRRHLCRKLDPKGQADWPERQAGRNKVPAQASPGAADACSPPFWPSLLCVAFRYRHRAAPSPPSSHTPSSVYGHSLGLSKHTQRHGGGGGSRGGAGGAVQPLGEVDSHGNASSGPSCSTERGRSSSPRASRTEMEARA